MTESMGIQSAHRKRENWLKVGHKGSKWKDESDRKEYNAKIRAEHKARLKEWRAKHIVAEIKLEAAEVRKKIEYRVEGSNAEAHQDVATTSKATTESAQILLLTRSGPDESEVDLDDSGADEDCCVDEFAPQCPLFPCK